MPLTREELRAAGKRLRIREPKCPYCKMGAFRYKCAFELGPDGCPRFEALREWGSKVRKKLAEKEGP